MSANLDELLIFGKQIANKAGELARSIRLSGDLKIKEKGPRDFVTAADLAVESLLVSAIKEKYPQHKFLTEEGSEGTEVDVNYKGEMWVIDPIDGTTNFRHGLHHVGVSLAYCNNGQVMCGIVAAPFLGEIFSAVRGKGAFRNDYPIKASTCSKISDALIATGFPYQRDDLTLLLNRLEKVITRCRDLRRDGACSIDICNVACGRLDGYYETVNAWDIAAARLIALEAGALASTSSLRKRDVNPELDGEEIIVAAPGLINELREILLSSK